jgi:hypothetical protein
VVEDITDVVAVVVDDITDVVAVVVFDIREVVAVEEDIKEVLEVVV